MPKFVFVFILFILLVLISFFRKSSKEIMSFSYWIFISYSFLLLTHFFSGITYLSGNVTRILPYFLFCVLLVIIGEKIGEKYHINFNKRYFKINVYTLFILSTTGTIILLYDIIRLNNINLGMRIEDLQISGFGVLGNLLSSLSIIVWLWCIYQNRINNMKIKFFLYFSFLSYIANGVISAGRHSILVIGSSTIILLIWSYKKRKETKGTNTSFKLNFKKAIGYLAIFLFFVSYLIFISNTRSGISDINTKINSFENLFLAKLPDNEVKEINKMTILKDFYVEFIFYYSHQLRRLDIIFQNYDHPPLMGLAQFHYIERRVQWLSGYDISAGLEKADFVATEIKGNFNSHTWGTFVASYIFDFGRFGTLIACFITGVFLGSLKKAMNKYPTPERIIRQVLIISGVLASIQMSPISELNWFFPLLLISFIKLYHNKLCLKNSYK